jgi:chromosome segregation ATPase
MSKNQIIIALVVLCLVGTIWGSVQDKKSTSLERQLAAMKTQQASAAPVMDEAATSDAQAIATQALAELEKFKSQNQALLADAASLKGSVASQQQEISSLKKALASSGSGSQSIEAMQAQLDKRTAEITKLEEAVVSTKSALEQKNAALAAAEEAAAGLENVKSALANSVDAYSSKSQELAAEVEEYGMRILSLEKALEERTKILVAGGEELARTKLNMNVLLSKIAAQNNSLEILEDTRVALEKELAMKFLIIEELQHQLSAQVVVEVVNVEEAPVVAPKTAVAEEAAVVEPVDAPAPAEDVHPEAVEEAPAH